MAAAMMQWLNQLLPLGANRKARERLPCFIFLCLDAAVSCLFSNPQIKGLESQEKRLNSQITLYFRLKKTFYSAYEQPISEFIMSISEYCHSISEFSYSIGEFTLSIGESVFTPSFEEEVRDQ